MQKVPFTKIQAYGNAYIFVNAFENTIEDPGELSRQMSNRYFGIGSDGMVLVCPSESCDVRMRIFNPDGTEAEMCGNALRGTANYAYTYGLAPKDVITVETYGGLQTVKLNKKDGIIESLTANIGKPRLLAKDVPVKTDAETFMHQEIVAGDQKFWASSLSWGNPHTLIEWDDLENLDIEKYGPLLECHPLFPNKTNVTFGRVLDAKHIEIREWERGTGETIGCGTGCCTSLVYFNLLGKCDREVDVKQPGGILHAFWNEEDEMIMTGESKIVCEGVFNYEVK